jgi:hypothetical protein
MIPIATMLALALAGSPYRPLPVEKNAPAQSICAKEKQLVDKKAAVVPPTNGGVANLPFAMGRRFRTLDEYLVHLKCRAAPIDLPWWREIRPGVYRYETTKPGAPEQIATRVELIKRFGFAK